MKNVLITGANSYIGDSVRDYLLQFPNAYYVRVMDTIGWHPTSDDFKGIDVVFNVAGIAHVKETAENRQLFYDVNRDLAVAIAQAAKNAGVRHFILLSTMSAYGLTEGHITKDTLPTPVNAYGKAKAQADEAIQKLECERFRFACLRPPMVYGKGCKGNYQRLRAFALKSPIFPEYPNQRSMIYIGNLCEFVKNCIDEEKRGLFFPQNDEYTNTSAMVRQIAQVHHKKIIFTKVFNLVLKAEPIGVVKKVFGSLTYERTDTIDKYGFMESIVLTEKE